MLRIRLAWIMLASAALACAQTATGRWVSKVTSDDEVREIVLALNVDSSGSISGYILAPQYEDRILQGKADGSQLSFSAERDGNNNTRQHRNYTATIEGSQLTLTVPNTNNRPPTVTHFTRESSEAPKPLTVNKISLPKPAPVKDNGLARTPPMGWNSWNKFHGRVNDQVVREVADAVAKNGMRDAGYVYINIDDTWEGTRDEAGNLRTNSKFPDMKKLADYVHSKGLKLGIYSSPGPRTCAGYAGSFQQEEQDARQYAAWGIDYLKYDWCSAARVYAWDVETMRGAYARMGEALLHSGRPIVYSLCQYGLLNVGEWGAAVGGNLWRTTGDIGDRWASLTSIADKQAGREKFAEVGHWNDPDMLEIGNGGMTDTEYQTHMSLWALLAAPLLAGNDLRDVKPDILQILTNKEVIAIDQDKLGKQATRVSKDGNLEVWSRPLADGEVAVGLFNRGDAAAKVTAKWSDIGVSGPHSLRNLWEHKNLGSFADQYSAEVLSHGVVMIKLAK